MDPNKYPSAPMKEWGEEKSSMGQAPPPPSYDNANVGYPAVGPAYPPQGQAFGAAPHYGGAPQYGGVPYGQQPYPQQGAITAQPAMYIAPGPLSNPVNDYLCYSIFTMLCCCLPLGIAALIYSIQAREANHIGDQQGAERNSRTARTLNHVALGLGLGSLILVIVYIVVMVSLTS
ncbi:proline-rich transmembrane protein 1-like [Takifugu rubripes]|uniref:proline-rich transmembrane protein 1-like n=1 Tax=Takifugu rubripes TaxID=31033 RepID=UPI000065F06E|nr:proline-rich transmembrane protein 1-like [Takifugu rubripes]|eukprot:XP_003965976.1 PREDICTED: proline-rich transmembrane protein 1-like [Takifugu rubripes]